MARLSREDRLRKVHRESLAGFDRVHSSSKDERKLSITDRRFASITGAQWEGPWGDMFENKPRFEINKVQNALVRIENEYRNNRISVDFVAKDGATNLDLADVCDGLYRADEQDSCAEEAYDNAFQEGLAGGFAAWRLKACYENEEDDENDYQRIRFEPIFDADTSVFFDQDAKRQNKSDAKRCWVIHAMTPDDYRDEWDDDPASWPKDADSTQFDWQTPDVVYVAEYYEVEEVRETIRTFSGIEDEVKYTDDELEEMGEALKQAETYTRQGLIDLAIADLASKGFVEVKKRSRKVRKVHKYIMSGGKVLEDCGYIAGKYIPIIPFYGKRWFVDNVERFMGHVRLAKDVQRLKNMVVSWLGEIAASSTTEKPIFTPEQVAGHEQMWSEDNVKKYPYQLINPITGPDGQEMVSGPVAYTKAPQIPPAMGALLQILDIDMAEILGNQQQGDKMVSNISGKAVEMIQQRLDMQAFIYLSNFAKAMQWCGTVWLSMAKELYTEPGRQMKMIGEMGNIGSVKLVEPMIVDGELTTRNDLTRADFDVTVDVGPSFTSRRDATVRALTGVMQMTADPEDQKILSALVLMNMEGEGLGDVNEYYRKRLVSIGVLQPNEEEREAMEAAAAQGQVPTAQDMYLLAEAEKKMAEADESRADTGLKIAKTAETEASTLLKLKEAGAPANAEG